MAQPRAKLLAALLLFAALCSVRAAPTPGALDPSFDPGRGIQPIINKPIPVRVIFPLADGSFLLGGIFTNYNGVQRPGVAKILEDGPLDETFIPDPSLNMPNVEVWSIAQQEDGKFLIAGIGGSPWRSRIFRLNTNG